MDVKDIRDGAIRTIDNYLNGKINATDASNWALRIIKTCSMNKLSERVVGSINLILDLNDVGQDWFPTAEELRQCRDGLITNSGPPAYRKIKLKSKTSRGIRKEMTRKIRDLRKAKKEDE